MDQDKLAAARAKWRDKVAKTSERFPERQSPFKSTSGYEIERLYEPTAPDPDYGDKLGFPGTYPFTRGVQPTMYRSMFWTMRQYSGFGDAKATNERYHFLLGQGQTGLSVAFDLPTQMGYDSDNPFVHGEVGKVGVAISSLDDMETLLDGIPLDKVSTSMTINSTASILLAFYIAVAKKQGVGLDKIRGTIQNDLLKEYMARGTYIYPPAQSMRIITDIFAFCKENVPNWNTISISGYHIREAGCTAAQEIAFTLADGIAYVEAAKSVGLDVDEIGPRLSFFFNGHNDFLEEVAKFRAARRLWAKIMKERFGSTNPKSQMLRFHTQTAGSMLTAQQVDNNVVRVTIQALAAVLGGTQSLHTNSRDEALALPTETSATIALRTQQIIAYESGAANTIDPLAGSYAVESMTDALEAQAFDYIEKIDKMGGMVEAIMQGFPQREIQNAAYKWQQEVDSSDRVIVGVNKFTKEEPPLADILRIDESVERSQKERLAALKARRDDAKVKASLAAITNAAKGDENLMPLIIEAVENLCTLGEIADSMREVFGLFEEVIVV
ncbi:MAG: methylmalonyl-CoA mutase family protein [Deltaproteobacteria bacterium]|nr:methylmalonyl-CoA mutase family protein [Deltaproteobacteria bacterium]MCB9489453.1 methylmalonyl-CoA mutase family protein [Deltaproteobacteria bacterium]